MMVNKQSSMKNIRTSYKQYKQDCKDTVDIKTYITIATLYIKFILSKVFEGFEVTIPAKLGTLKIIGTKQEIKFDEDGNIKGLSPNWRQTKELWEKNPEAKERKQIIFNTNEHSDGVRYKFLWSKRRVLITNKTIYSLRMTRDNKREVFRQVTQGKEYLTTN